MGRRVRVDFQIGLGLRVNFKGLQTDFNTAYSHGIISIEIG